MKSMMRLTPAICCALFVSILLATATPAAELTTEPLSKIKANIEGKTAVLVDVREKSEWDAGHIDGAIFLPLRDLQNGVTNAELKRLPKDKVLYIHCVVGKRAVRAGTILERYGYTVRPIKPGYKEMISAGFPKAKE